MQAQSSSVPTPGSPKELELLIGVGRSIPFFQKMTRVEQDELLNTLEAYECLGQVSRLLEWRLHHASALDSASITDHLWLMRIYYLGLEDFERFVDVACRAVRALKISFSIVKIHIADGILGEENFVEQVELYSRLIDAFANKVQQVALLERLCLIYEKKLFLDEKVDATYHRLLEVDPDNVKALRFFKFFYLQTGQYYEAAHQLERLARVLTNPFEKQRSAHELAQIMLYNLNNPSRAREIIESQCSDSQLDTHHTLIEALERLGAYEDLVAVLRRAVDAADGQAEKSSLELRISMVYLKSGKLEQARVSAKRAVELMPTSFLAHEGLLSVCMEYGDTSGILEALEGLLAIVTTDVNKNEIGRLLERGRAVLAREGAHV